MHEHLKDKYQKFNDRENNKNNNKEKNYNFENNYNNNNIYFEKEKNSSGKKTSSSNFDYEEIISNLPNNNLNMNMNMNLDMNNKDYSFNSLKNNNSVNLFLDYVDNILKHENICLILKESLSLREDVTFKELFCLFDYHQNKNISIHEFKKVCKNILSLYPTTDQIGLIFTRYDINKDEKLNLREFLNMICPIKKEYLGILFGDKKIKKPFHSELSEKSKKIIVNLMKTIILNESNYYEIKEKMKNSDFNASDLWHTLMEFSKSKNSLDHHEFGRFLKSNSYHLTSYEIEVIFNKFDFDKDDFISFDDFNHEFSA
jgi:Ca2+-binding EF-hand superfamily protein